MTKLITKHVHQLVLLSFLVVTMIVTSLPGQASAAGIFQTVEINPGQSVSGIYSADQLILYKIKIDEDCYVSLKATKDPWANYTVNLYTAASPETALPALKASDVCILNDQKKYDHVSMDAFQLMTDAYATRDAEAYFSLSAGTYYIQIKPCTQSGKPNFKFSVETNPFKYASDIEPNNSYDKATASAFGDWQEGQMAFNGIQGDESREDWFAVNIPAAGRYALDFTSDGLFNGSLLFYTRDGQNPGLTVTPGHAAKLSTAGSGLEFSQGLTNLSLSDRLSEAYSGQGTVDFVTPGVYNICIKGANAGSYQFRLTSAGPVVITPPANQTPEAPVNPETPEDTANPPATDNTPPANNDVPANNTPPSSSNDLELIFLVDQSFYNANGTITAMDVAPYTYNDRTFVPVRALANGIGIPDTGIIWNPVDQTVTLTDGVTTLSMVIGKAMLFKNGQGTVIDVSPVMTSNRVFLPARYVAEAFGLQVSWDAQSQSIIIRGQRVETSDTPPQNQDTNDTSDATSPTYGTIDLDGGSYTGNLKNGMPCGNGTWIDKQGRIKSGSFAMTGDNVLEITDAHVSFAKGDVFTGTYSATLYTIIEHFDGHIAFSNGNTFDGTVDNTADGKQHMIGTYTYPSGKTVYVDSIF